MKHFEDTWRAAVTAVGRESLLFHDLRRSFARAMRRAGVDETTIMAIGGWRTATIFRRYAIVDGRDLTAAQDVMAKVLVAAVPAKVAPLSAGHQRSRRAGLPTACP